MTQEQFFRACYETVTLILLGGVPLGEQRPAPARDENNPSGPAHLLWMLDQANAFHVAGKADKANRWLGFVQGAVATHGWAGLEELKRANMPEGETFDGERV